MAYLHGMDSGFQKPHIFYSHAIVQSLRSKLITEGTKASQFEQMFFDVINYFGREAKKFKSWERTRLQEGGESSNLS